MGKLVKLTENDLESLVKKVISEGYPRREIDRKETRYRKSDFKPYEREKELQSVFGPYGQDIPVQVIEYIRKNPQLIIDRLKTLYPSRFNQEVNDEISDEDIIEDEYRMEEDDNWISKSIKRPNSLRKKLNKKSGEKITSNEIEEKLIALRQKDNDKETPGVQGLGKSDMRTYRQLNLTKTLRNLNK